MDGECVRSLVLQEAGYPSPVWLGYWPVAALVTLE